MVDPQVVEGKSPLTSTVLQAAFINFAAAVVGYYYPTVGDWMHDHNAMLMGALGTVLAYGRHKADQPIDWSNWTIGGIGIKF